MRHFKKVILTYILLLLLIKPSFSQAFWESVGPFGGSIFSLLVIDDSITLIGAKWGCVFKSNDHGIIWNRSNVSNCDITVLELDKNNNILAGDYHYHGNVYISYDFGSNWHFLKSFSYSSIYSIAVDSNNWYYIGTDDGIYRSANQGINWSYLEDLPAEIASICVLPNNDIFVGTKYNGLFKSVNHGESWTFLGLDTLYASINNIIITNNEELIISTAGWAMPYTSGQGIFRSLNMGISWNLIGFNNKTVYSMVLGANNVLYACVKDLGLFSTCDYGQSWDYLGLQDIFLYSLDMESNGRIYTGALLDQGIYVSDNFGNNWYQSNYNINNFTISSLYSYNYNEIYTGTSNGLIYYLNENVWDTLGVFDRGIVSIAKDNDDILFVCLYTGHIYRSIDNGNLWEHIYSGLPNGECENLFVNNANYIYASIHNNNGIYISIDQGSNWIGSNITTNINFIVEDQQGYLYASSRNKFYCSNDSGFYWNTVHEFSNSIIINSLVISSTNNLYIGLTGDSSGVFVSHDQGYNWELSGLQEFEVYCLSSSFIDMVFAATSGGFYFLDSNFDDWILLDNSFGGQIFSLCTDDENNLYSGTKGHSVIKSINPITSNKNFIKNQNSYIIYPNPTSDVIHINNPKIINTKTILTIYTVDGKLVNTINLEEIKNTIDIDLYYLKNGIYFLCFKNNQFCQTFKIIKK